MKKSIYLVISTIILFFFLFKAFTYNFSEIKTKRFFYSYPNGYIGFTNSENRHLIGINILTANEIPQINYRIDEKYFYDENKVYKLVDDFLFYFIVIFGISAASFYFLFRRFDLYLFLLFISLSSFLFSNFLVLLFEEYLFLFYFSLLNLSFLILNLSRRLKGKDVPLKWIIPEISFCLALSYIGSTEIYNSKIFSLLSSLGISLLFFSIFICILVLSYDLVKYSNRQEIFLRKASLAVYLFFCILLPVLSFQKNFFQYTYYPILMLILASPFLFILGSNNFVAIPDQFYFGSSLVGFLLISVYVFFFYVFFYILNFLKQNYFIQNLDILYIFIIFVSVYFINPLKLQIKSLVKKYTFDNNRKFNQALEEIFELSSEPIFLRKSFRNFIKKINEVLGIEHVIILVSDEKFPSLVLKQVNLLRLTEKSNIWSYLRYEKDVIITSTLSIGSGIRSDVYRFLKNLEIQLAFPMYGFEEDRKIDAFFLVGEKKTNKSFSLGEIRFIQECARFADLIIHNYQLLLNDIEKKRQERTLKAASSIENTILNSRKTNLNIKEADLEFFSSPASEVNGDYVEVFPISNDTVAIFLGDVTGHGLGSSYIASAVRALISDLIKNDFDLVDIFDKINSFLLKKYAGSEFMTLVAGVYDLKKGEFNFINAGHLSPLILKSNGKLEAAKENNRVLGVLNTVYETKKIILDKNDKLILYSDGITETFNSKDEIYGENRFKELIQKNSGLSAKENILKLQNDLNIFREGITPLDDTSMIYLRRI